MKHIFSILAGLFAIPLCGMTQALPTMPPGGPNGVYDDWGRYPAGQVNTVPYYSSVAGHDLNMLVYTPPNYDPMGPPQQRRKAIDTAIEEMTNPSPATSARFQSEILECATRFPCLVDLLTPTVVSSCLITSLYNCADSGPLTCVNLLTPPNSGLCPTTVAVRCGRSGIPGEVTA